MANLNASNLEPSLSRKEKEQMRISMSRCYEKRKTRTAAATGADETRLPYRGNPISNLGVLPLPADAGRGKSGLSLSEELRLLPYTHKPPHIPVSSCPKGRRRRRI
jgi:hypothetical protein